MPAYPYGRRTLDVPSRFLTPQERAMVHMRRAEAEAVGLDEIDIITLQPWQTTADFGDRIVVRRRGEREPAAVIARLGRGYVLSVHAINAESRHHSLDEALDALIADAREHHAPAHDVIHGAMPRHLDQPIRTSPA